MADTASVITVLDACASAGASVILRSAPGSGKSSAVRALAKSKGVMCETVLGSLREPSDFAGLPVITDAGVRLEAPSWAKRLAAAGEGILLLDELTTSPPAVQAAMLAVVLDRTVGDLQLPEGVQVIAACNPPDQAAGGYDLEPPLANRLCHIDFEPTIDEWLDGMATGWSAEPASRAGIASPSQKAAAVASVVGFVRHRPNLLYAYPVDRAAAGGAWPSRRTWSMTANVLAHLRTDDVAAIRTAVFGLVGEGAGAEYLTWAATADLPDPAEVTEDPSIVNWAAESKRPDRVWAVLTGVVTLAAHRGTVEAFRKAWGPLSAAAGAGMLDVAGAAALTLTKARPAKASIPNAARMFIPILQDAGLLKKGAA